MTTQYTSILKLALPVQGELSGTWGDVVNDNITSMVEEAVAGRAVINTWTTNSHVLTTADGTTSESRCAMLEFTDTGAALTGAATVVCPNASKLYVCKNNSGQQVTIKTAAGTGVAIPNGQTMFVFCDGTNVEQCETNFNSLSFNGYTLNFGGAVTTAGAFTTSGAYALTLTTTGATNVTLPTTGTLATLDGTETLTNKTLTAPTISSPTLTGSISATDLTISGNTTIGDASSDTLTVNSTITSNLIFTDNTYDIGAVGATRPRNLYLSGNATIGGTVTLSGGIDVTGALGVDGDFDVNTDKFTVASATGNTLVAGTLGVTGITTATGGLNVDTISEITASGGVTVDGVLLKDGGATLTGDLTVDTDTLYVDSTNDRVGVNEATPLEALHVTTSDSGTTINKTVGSTSGPVFVLDNTDDTTNNLAAIQFASSGSSSTDVTATTGIYSINTGRGGTYSYGDLAFYTTNSGGTHTEAMRIDSSQRVLIGTSSSINGYYLQVAENSGYAGVSALRYTNDAFGAYLNLGKSRTTTIGGNAIVQDNDVVGYITFSPNDGLDLVSISSQIQGEIDGTPGANDVPGRLVFKTTLDGTSGATERMRINNAGDVTIGNAADARARLEVYDSGVSAVYDAGDLSTWRVMQVRNNIESATGTAAGIAFGGDGSGDTETAGIVGISDNSTGGIMQLAFITATGNNSLEAMRIDSSQRVLIGLTSAQNVGSVTAADLEVETTGIGASIVSTAGAAGPAGVLALGHKRGAGGIVLDDDALGEIRFSGHDGSDLISEAAKIRGSVDGTPGSNDMPGRLEFYTTSDGSSSPTERMRIDSDGLATFYYSTKNTRSVYGGYTAQTLENSNVNAGILNFTQQAWNTANGVGYIRMENHSASDQDSSEFTFHTGDLGGAAEAMRIDSSRRVLIGHTSAQTFSLTPKVSLLGTDASSSAHQVGRFQNGAFASYYQFAKSRATTVGNHVIVQDDDTIGNIRALADDGVNYDAVAASIEFQVDGTPGVNDMPGRLVFSTSADGSDSPTERMRIDSSGHIGVDVAPAAWDTSGNTRAIQVDNASFATINGGDPFITNNAYWNGSNWVMLNTSAPTNYYQNDSTHYFRGASSTTSGNNVSWSELARIDGDGLKFNGDTAASNALDDYEEGDFAPVYAISGGSVTTGSNAGRYVKVGNFVFFTFRLRTTAVSGTGALTMTLPFTSSSENRSGGSRGYARDWGVDMPEFTIYTPPSSSVALFYRHAMNVSTALSVTGSQMGTGGDDNVLEGSIVYRSA